MTHLNRPYGLTIALVAAVVLSACASSDVPPTPNQATETSSEESPTIVLTQDEAVAAATKVRRQYDEVVWQLYADPLLDASLLSTVATSEQVDRIRASRSRLAEMGQHTTGSVSYVNVLTQEYSPAENRLVLLVCNDVSGLRVLDANGSDVTPVDRPDLVSLKVTFDVRPTGLKVEENVSWDGSSVC